MIFSEISWATLPVLNSYISENKNDLKRNLIGEDPNG